MSRFPERWVKLPLPELIHTTANCGRLIKEARELAASSDTPPAWFDPWLKQSQGYRGIRMLTMWGRAEEVAKLARLLGIACDADRVFEATFDVAIEIDEALDGYPFNLYEPS